MPLNDNEGHFRCRGQTISRPIWPIRRADESLLHQALAAQPDLAAAHYETLVDDLPGETKRLLDFLDFLDLPWDERCRDFHKTERLIRTASQSQVRNPLSRDGVGRWSRYHPHIGPLLEALGPLADQDYKRDALSPRRNPEMPLKRALPLFILLLALTGCAAESCHSGPCSPDERLVEAVRAEIAKHPALMTDTIRIQSEGGTVYLYGLVSTNVELVEAGDVAKATPGVKKVVNLISVDNTQR